VATLPDARVEKLMLNTPHQAISKVHITMATTGQVGQIAFLRRQRRNSSFYHSVNSSALSTFDSTVAIEFDSAASSTASPLGVFVEGCRSCSHQKRCRNGQMRQHASVFEASAVSEASERSVEPPFET